jgi:adenylate kinase family enzyme
MKIAIVGGCGSGKSTIAAELQKLGYQVYVVGQEHSAIKSLWAARSPDVLIYLHVTLEAVHQRRSEDWPAWLYSTQQERLADARSHATISVNTAEMSIPETVDAIVTSLESLEGHDSPRD